MSDDVSADFLKKSNDQEHLRNLQLVYGDKIPEHLLPKPSYTDMAMGALEDFGRGMMELPQAIAGGAIEAVEETVDTIDSVGDWLSYNLGQPVYDENGLYWKRGEELLEFEQIAKDKGINLGVWQGQDQVDTEIADMEMNSRTGEFLKDTAQFLTGFMGGGSALKSLKILQGASGATRAAKAASAGAVSDAVAFDPDDPNVSNLIETYVEKYPELRNPITEYLAIDEDDFEAEKRFKRALEGVGLGVMTDGVLIALKSLRNKRIEKLSQPEIKQQADQEFVTEAIEDIDNPLGDESGPLFTTHTVQKSSDGAGERAIAEANRQPDLSAYPDYKIKPEPKLASPEKRLVDTPQGKFVSLEDGSVDLGKVDSALAETIGQKAAPVRLAEGNESFGLLHIEKKHGASIRKVSGLSAEEFVYDVLNSFNIIAEGGKGRLIAAKQNGKAKVAIIELERTGDYYTVITAGIRDKKALAKKKTLWSQTRKTDSQTSLDHIEDKASESIVTQETLEINLAALNTPEDIDRLLTEVTAHNAQNTQKARRGVQSHADTEIAADALGMRVDRLLKRKVGEAFNAEQALAARDIHQSVVRQVSALAEKVANKATATDADKVAFLRSLKVYQAVEAQMMGVRAEAGRALQQFRIIPKGNAKISDQISALLEGRDGAKVNKAAEVLRDILKENPNALPDTIAQIARPKGADMLLEIWINNLLSGPTTHFVNIASNTLVPLWSISERALSGGMRKAVGGDGVELEEATEMLFGMVRGYRDGFRLAAKALRTGESSDVLQKIETADYKSLTANNLSDTMLGKVINKVSGNALKGDNLLSNGVDLLGETVRGAGRFLAAEDELFRAVGFRMELHAQAMRRAKSEGLEGAALSERMREIILDPPDEIYHIALHNSRYQTFTKELGENGKWLQKFANQYPVARIFAPFIRTPINIMKYFGERTPLALASSAVKAEIRAGGARRDLAIAKISLGSMVMATVADLTLEGHITGGGPTDKRQRKLWLDMGYLPYSIKIGDKWHSYHRLEPLGMLFGVGADTAEIMSQAYDADQAQLDELAGAAVMSITRNVTNKAFMTGVTTAIDAINNPNDAMVTYYFANLAGSLIPAAVRQSNPDTVRRDNQGIVTENGNRELDFWESVFNNIKSRVPGYSEDLPAKRSLWGEIEHYPQGPVPFSPVAVSKQKSDPVNEELLRLGAPIGLPSNIVDGIRLTPHEYWRYVELSGGIIADPEGRTLKQHIGDLIADPEYAQLGQDDQSRVIRMVTDKYRSAARERLKMEMPALQKLIMRRKLERR